MICVLWVQCIFAHYIDFKRKLCRWCHLYIFNINKNLLFLMFFFGFLSTSSMTFSINLSINSSKLHTNRNSLNCTSFKSFNIKLKCCVLVYIWMACGETKKKLNNLLIYKAIFNTMTTSLAANSIAFIYGAFVIAIEFLTCLWISHHLFIIFTI